MKNTAEKSLITFGTDAVEVSHDAPHRQHRRPVAPPGLHLIKPFLPLFTNVRSKLERLSLVSLSSQGEYSQQFVFFVTYGTFEQTQ